MESREFRHRRRDFIEQIGSKSIAIIPTAIEKLRNRDVDYPFRPDSDFYYLTGFAEPEAIAVIIPERDQGEYLLFCREKDPKKEMWHGHRAGLDGAKADFGADDAFPIDDIGDILPGLLEGKERIFYAMGCHAEFDTKLLGWLNKLRCQSRAGVHTPGEIIDLSHILHDMRLIKSPAEIETMRRAANISAEAHRRAMQMTRRCKYEFQVEAELLHHFMLHGCRSPAYPSIVGGGVNGCTLHYTANNQPLQEGDLLLIDAAAELDYYAADITRTFPINGKFSKNQRLLYQIVLKAQQAAMAQVKPGNHWNAPHEAAVEVVTAGLMELNILKGSNLSSLIKKEAYKPFFPHRTGHWLGMDVHDVGDYKIEETWRELEPGMVLTIEPGLYIPPKSKKVAKKWWGIAIRIEDDLLVTDSGYEVLSAAIPKEIDAIEAIMAEAEH
ncbi:Xaa-Pro aminopeptidase [Ectothiorhodospiraceae bacterium BW-2]|nr:Xaa-Pro aminopeptidase [Ectothiorhodospiraceae bacterium BW-2]